MERETGQPASEADAFEEMIDHALVSWQVDDLWLRGSLRRSMGRKSLPGRGQARRVKLHLLSRLWRLPEVVEVEPLVGVVVAAALEVACVGF